MVVNQEFYFFKYLKSSNILEYFAIYCVLF